MSDPDVFDLCVSVRSSEDLSKFILALKSDFEINKDGWENWSVPHALDSMAGWVTDMEGYRALKGEPALGTMNPFELCAHVLMAAKIYE